MSAARLVVYMLAWTFLLCAWQWAGLVGAQDYPTKPVRIVTSEAGGGSDLPVRVIVQGLAPGFGQPSSSTIGGIPTVASSGLPGYVCVFQAGMFAPTGTPAPIINRLNRDIVQLIQRPETRDKLLGMGMEPVGNSPQEFAAVIKNEVTVMGKVIKEANIRDD